MSKIWDRLINIGNDESYELPEQARIRLLNKMVFIAMSVIIALMVVRFFTAPDTTFAAIQSLLFLILLIIYNYLGEHNLSRIVGCFGFPVSITYVIYVHGASFGEFTAYLLLVVLTIILLDSNKKIRNICVAWTTFLAIGSYYYVSVNFLVNPISSNTIGSIFLFIGYVTLLFFIISFYQAEVEEYQNHNENLIVDLKNKNIELERFSFISSHDLKEPVKNIIGFTDYTKRMLESGNTEKAMELLEFIGSDAKRMNQLIEDTLEYASLDKRNEQPELIDLNQVVKAVQTIYAEVIEAKKVYILLTNPLPKLFAIKSEVSILVKNIILNAITYNESENPIIEISSERIENQQIISVKDNGNGIDDSQIENIFIMYRRLVTREKYIGTGLGLSMCKKIIEKMGGKIWARNNVGSGSTFYFSVRPIEESLEEVLQPKRMTSMTTLQVTNPAT